MSFGENGSVKAKFSHRTVETEIPNLSYEKEQQQLCAKGKARPLCAQGKARCGQPKTRATKKRPLSEGEVADPQADVSYTHRHIFET